MAITEAAAGSPGRIHLLQVIGNAIVGGMECWVERRIERLPRERFTVSAACPFDGVFADRLHAHLPNAHLRRPAGDDDEPWAAAGDAGPGTAPRAAEKRLGALRRAGAG